MAGRLKHYLIESIAVAALTKAGRPPWEDPVVLGLALGFEMLPCLPTSTPEYERTSATRLVFAAEPNPVEHARAVRLALARGLLLRSGLSHDRGDMAALARRLGADLSGNHKPPLHVL